MLFGEYNPRHGPTVSEPIREEPRREEPRNPHIRGGGYIIEAVPPKINSYRIKARICYEENSINSQYFAMVDVQIAEEGKLIPFDTYRVVLNGPGVSKARQKITRELKSKGIDVHGFDRRLADIIKITPLEGRI